MRQSAAQRALQAEPATPASGALHARIALHTGAASLHEGEYFGLPLNRAARLLAAGHGGQMLLSGATQELVRDQLPPGVELRDLGEQRLKDLIRPERVFQVLAPDLPADFPPLRTLDTHRNNLPAPGHRAHRARARRWRRWPRCCAAPTCAWSR